MGEWVRDGAKGGCGARRFRTWGGDCRRSTTGGDGASAAVDAKFGADARFYVFKLTVNDGRADCPQSAAPIDRHMHVPIRSHCGALGITPPTASN